MINKIEEAIETDIDAALEQKKQCELCEDSGYFKSNTAEYEGECPNMPHPITQEAPMENCERCPQCHKVPSVDMDKENIVWLSCALHGHMAQGDTLDKAVTNWNHYVKAA